MILANGHKVSTRVKWRISEVNKKQFTLPSLYNQVFLYLSVCVCVGGGGGEGEYSPINCLSIHQYRRVSYFKVILG